MMPIHPAPVVNLDGKTYVTTRTWRDRDPGGEGVGPCYRAATIARDSRAGLLSIDTWRPRFACAAVVAP